MITITFIELIIAGLVLLLIVGLLKEKKGASSQTGLQSDQDEARMIQEMYEELQRMDKRIEALETLLLDRARDQEKV